MEYNVLEGTISYNISIWLSNDCKAMVHKAKVLAALKQ